MPQFNAKTPRALASLLVGALVETTLDGILVVDPEGKIVHVNEQFVSMWGMAPELVDAGDEEALLSAAVGQLKDPKGYIEKVRYLYAHPDEKSHDDLELTDARVFERYSVPLTDKSGTHHGRIWYFRDVSELRRTRIELVANARDSAMTEGAAGVLNDVSEVLNHINVTIDLLRAKVVNSTAEKLGRLAELLRQHESDLATFVTEDPRGMEIPNVVSMLDDGLHKERHKMLDWIGELSRSVDKVKVIVDVQQAFTGRGGVLESCDLMEIIEDSMKIESAGIRGSDVAIELDLGVLPEVELERHKIVQVLVELLGNARRAAIDGPAQEPRITIRTRSFDEDRVHLDVQDNGVGITHQNLLRVFQHGYTTSKDAKGYGLHVAQKIASELGGSLIARSEGLDHGACFVLEFPISVTSLLGGGP